MSDIPKEPMMGCDRCHQRPCICPVTSNDRLCPKCGTKLEPYAEVDNGVGTMYGGPWGCPACHWTEEDEAAEEIKRLEREEIERPLREEIARLRALLTEVHSCGAGAHMLQRIAEALAGSPAEAPGRIGPEQPDNDMVICPHCTSQFRAIPVNVQRAVDRLEAALRHQEPR